MHVEIRVEYGVKVGATVLLGPRMGGRLFMTNAVPSKYQRVLFGQKLTDIWISKSIQQWFFKLWINKYNAFNNVIPIRGRATKWDLSLALLPKNINIRNDNNGKNKNDIILKSSNKNCKVVNKVITNIIDAFWRFYGVLWILWIFNDFYCFLLNFKIVIFFAGDVHFYDFGTDWKLRVGAFDRCQNRRKWTSPSKVMTILKLGIWFVKIIEIQQNP